VCLCSLCSILFVRDGAVCDWPEERWEEPDWVELEPCSSALNASMVDPGDFLYDEHHDWIKYRLGVLVFTVNKMLH